MPYTIKLKHFEGPFDLLLFFIERDEIDIYDIPIAKITDDFLAYIREMESLNIDLASEFILVAASLMRIKAKMLLPRKPIDEEGNELDPRQELVDRLLEYKQYKGVVDDLRKMEEEQSRRLARGNISDELQEIANKALVDLELENLDLFNLLKAFTRLMERSQKRAAPIHTINRYPYTIGNQQTMIREKIKSGRQDFESLFSRLENRVHAIVTFLALLEMVNLQELKIIQGDDTNQFWVEAKIRDEEE